MNTTETILSYLQACHSGDSRLQRILADRLSTMGIDADAVWNEDGSLDSVSLSAEVA